MAADITALLSHGLIASAGGGVCDYPIEGDVRFGVDYGDGMTGSLVVSGDVANPLTTHSPADVIRWALIALGMGSDPGVNNSWPIFSDREPTSPDELITVYNTAGTNDGRVMAGEVQGPRGIQVRVRSKTPQAGWMKADSIRTALAESLYRMTLTIGAAQYLVQSVSKIGNILALGKESPTSQRNLFTINAVTTITQCS